MGKHIQKILFLRNGAYTRIAIVAAAALAVLLIVVAAFAFQRSSQQVGRSTADTTFASNAVVAGAEAASTAGQPDAPVPGVTMPLTSDAYALNPTDLLSISGSDSAITFNLSPAGEPCALSAEQLQPVYDALDQIHENGSCGFVFLDVGTGHGIAYNADEEMYIASAAKALLAYYATQEGDAWDYDIEAAITSSDNDSFESFGYQYFTSDYIDWLADRDIEHNLWSGDLYPPTSARSLACVWAEILQFAREGSDESNWFADLLLDTNQSYIRDALEDRGVSVMNKAGWIADWEFNSITDAGIVQAGPYTYLMIIETDQPAWGGGEEAVSDLASALFDLRFVM